MTASRWRLGLVITCDSADAVTPSARASALNELPRRRNAHATHAPRPRGSVGMSMVGILIDMPRCLSRKRTYGEGKNLNMVVCCTQQFGQGRRRPPALFLVIYQHVR